MDPAEKPRMDVPGRIRKDQLEKIAIRLRQPLRFDRQRLRDLLLDRVGNGLPDRALAHAFDVVDGFVERLVRESAKRLPVGGIETLGGFRMGNALRAPGRA